MRGIIGLQLGKRELQRILELARIIGKHLGVNDMKQCRSSDGGTRLLGEGGRKLRAQGVDPCSLMSGRHVQEASNLLDELGGQRDGVVTVLQRSKELGLLSAIGVVK